MTRISTLQVFHQGSSPIKVLGPDITSVFQTIYPDFLTEINVQVTQNGLHRSIQFDSRQESIDELAYIEWDQSGEGQIYISEAYCIFIWTLCHIVLTLYRERNTGLAQNIRVIRAGNTFQYGLSLYQNWTDWDLRLPNPQEFEEEDMQRIGDTNGLFLYAICLILAHEFSHHRLGHQYSPPDRDLQDEYEADQAAVQILLKGVDYYKTLENKGLDRVESIQLGALLGIGSLLFPAECWEGGIDYPNSEERFFDLIGLFSISEDDELWRFGTVVLAVWALTQNKSMIEPIRNQSAKENYQAFARHLKRQQPC